MGKCGISEKVAEKFETKIGLYKQSSAITPTPNVTWLEDKSLTKYRIR